LVCFLKKQNVKQDTLARHFPIDKGAVARAVTKLVDAGMYCVSPTRTIDGQSGSSGQKKGETIAPEI
jgi:predicted transcriptional regulator